MFFPVLNKKAASARLAMAEKQEFTFWLFPETATSP
jgi:hypothetical protein